MDATPNADGPISEVTARKSAYRHRSPLLGEALRLELPQGPVEAFVRGDGPPLVLAHGWLANANLWRGSSTASAIASAASRSTSLSGASRSAALAARLDAEDCGALILAALDALDLRDATLVGNDSGGAYSQIALARAPERVGRLVLTSCETPYDEFPPPPFDGLPAVARTLRSLGRLLGALERPRGPRGFRRPSACWSSTRSTSWSPTPTRCPACMTQTSCATPRKVMAGAVDRCRSTPPAPRSSRRWRNAGPLRLVPRGPGLPDRARAPLRGGAGAGGGDRARRLLQLHPRGPARRARRRNRRRVGRIAADAGPAAATTPASGPSPPPARHGGARARRARASSSATSAPARSTRCRPSSPPTTRR